MPKNAMTEAELPKIEKKLIKLEILEQKKIREITCNHRNVFEFELMFVFIV